MLDELKAIQTQCAEHQKEVDPATPMSKALKRVQHNVRRVEKEIRGVMEDEECGYTVNRVEEWACG